MLTEQNRRDRLTGIGASEIPSIVFPDQWGSPLSVYEAKVAPPPPPETTPDQERGEELEHAILKWTARRRKIIVEPNADIVRHPTFAWCIATPDGFEIGADAVMSSELKIQDRHLVPIRVAVAEAKAPRRSTGWTDPEQDPTGIPRRYFVQGQWQMAATGLPRCILSAFVHGDLWTYDIAADPELQGALLEAGEAFWRRVEARDPPSPESPLDAGVLGRLFDQKRKDLVQPVSVDDAVDLVRQFKAAQAAEETAGNNASVLKARIIALIGEHAGLDLGDAAKVTYKRARDSTIIPWEGIAREAGATPELIAKRTTTKPGSRRFLASLKEEE